MRGNPEDQQPEERLREIPQWVCRYAQNRTLPVVGNLVAFAFGCVAMGGLSFLTGWAHRTGNRPLAGVFVVVLAAFVVFWIWFSLMGGRRFERWVTRWAYRREGEVSVGASPEAVTRGLAPLVGLAFGFCVLASVGLGVLGFIPIRYMQPVSALYCVPFLAYLGVRSRSSQSGSPFMLLWPVLYGLHAILLVAGAPVYFGGRLEALNMLIPTLGYGLLAATLAHLYSRYALRRLRSLARAPGAGDDGEGV